LKRVLHTVDTWGPGGAETVCVELASGLDPARFQSSAAVIREGWVHDALRARGVDVSMARTGRGPVDIAYLGRLLTIARRQRVSLIQSHLLTANLYGGFVARLLGIPAVATFHGMVDVDPGDRLAGVKLRLITANATRLVFVSEALRQHFSRAHAVPGHRTMVIPNGIDPQHFRPAPTGVLRQALGLSTDAVLVGAVGNLRPAKGYDDLLEVAALLRDEYPQVHFVVVGERSEPMYARLVARRNVLGLDTRVHFIGFRDDVAAVLNGVDFYVSTSRSEGFSLTTIQAMACGLAVAATRSGGPEEIVTDGEDGLLVPVSEPAAMARAVASLATDVEWRRRLARVGRETVIRRFSLRRMIEAYEAVYDDTAVRT
jgi:glycosyltransferase involved in cell wall biosynthesis